MVRVRALIKRLPPAEPAQEGLQEGWLPRGVHRKDSLLKKVCMVTDNFSKIVHTVAAKPEVYCMTKVAKPEVDHMTNVTPLEVNQAVLDRLQEKDYMNMGYLQVPGLHLWAEHMSLVVYLWIKGHRNGQLRSLANTAQIRPVWLSCLPVLFYGL